MSVNDNVSSSNSMDPISSSPVPSHPIASPIFSSFSSSWYGRILYSCGYSLREVLLYISDLLRGGWSSSWLFKFAYIFGLIYFIVRSFLLRFFNKYSRNTHDTVLSSKYDYIIVGGGSSGVTYTHVFYVYCTVQYANKLLWNFF